MQHTIERSETAKFPIRPRVTYVTDNIPMTARVGQLRDLVRQVHDHHFRASLSSAAAMAPPIKPAPRSPRTAPALVLS